MSEPLNYEHELWPAFADAVIEELDANGCDGTLVRIVTILRDLDFDPPSTGAGLEWLRDQGGFCLCEVVLNVIGNEPDPDDPGAPDKLTT